MSKEVQKMYELNAVKQHHNKVKEKGYHPVFSVLIGAQNYHLDDEQSDIDTFTFVMPSLKDLYTAREPVSGEFEVDDGKCMYKDIRLGLNLLKKTNPNSVECFIGKYKYYSPLYKNICEKYFTNENLEYMAHCNHIHMLNAIAGMSKQLTKRNMPAGKRYSHALRMNSMCKKYISSYCIDTLLELLPADYKLAFAAKRDTEHEDEYNRKCEEIAAHLYEVHDTFEVSPYRAAIENYGIQLIEHFQKDLFIKYINNEVYDGN